AHAYFAIGEYKLALEAFDYAVITNEDFELAYLDYAELCYCLHMWDKALSLYIKLTQLIEPDEELLCRIGECLEHLGEYDKGRVYLYRALGMNPKYAETYYHIGQCYAQEGAWGSSLHFYKQAVKLDEEREDYLSALAKNHQMLGYPQRAIPFYKRAIEIGPELGVNWAELTQILIQENKIEDALNLVEDAFEHTYDAGLFYCKAACEFKKRDFATAMDTLKEALLEDHGKHQMLFAICPELIEDRGVQAIIRYYDPNFFEQE
ncbi:MAG: tetratricopeptide repeat protein, partial [Saprospiraceae bacterium]